MHPDSNKPAREGLSGIIPVAASQPHVGKLLFKISVDDVKLQVCMKKIAQPSGMHTFNFYIHVQAFQLPFRQSFTEIGNSEKKWKATITGIYARQHCEEH